MDLFKVRKFRRAHKPEPEKESEGKPVPSPEEPKKDINGGGGGGGEDLSKTNNKSVDVVAEAEDDEDDDFITNEVKRRLKELRRNSFMVLIPEEESLAEQEEEEEEDDGGGEAGEAICGEWRDVEAEGRQWWGGFDVVYDKYCDRMLFFDRLSLLQLNENGCCHMPTTPSPKSSSKKLPSPFRCLSLKKFDDHEDETEHLQQPQNDPYQDLETAYVGQMCLTWEALHCLVANHTNRQASMDIVWYASPCS
ncbi:unnamed protein product [Linum trigynum]|uniref:Uncharacterized protein n=1 Tax=Linum trigynum TaxID=586398 RepID=A0AAV2FJJ3_9ROSI